MNEPQDVLFISHKAPYRIYETYDRLYVAFPCGNFGNSGNSGNTTGCLVSSTTSAEISTNFPVDVLTTDDRNVGAIVAGSVVGFLALCGISAIILWILIFRKKFKKYHFQDEIQVEKTEMNETPASPNMDPWKIHFTEIELEEEKLGSGVSGMVMKARWRGADVVVKTLKNIDQDHTNLFLKEATHMMGLRRHPNVCQFLGIVWEADQPLMIVTEFMSEGSLWDIIADGRLQMDMKIISEMAIDAASGMTHIHKENILHCDLAARNLLIRRTGDHLTLKIADFGMAHQTQSDDYSPTGITSMAIRWCSPELLSQHRFTKSSDVWAFGVVMWEMSEQRRPYYQIASNQKVAQFISDHGRLSRPSTIPIDDGFWNLIQRCWEEDPDLRPRFEELAHLLVEIKNTMYPEAPIVDGGSLTADGGAYQLTPIGCSENDYSLSSL
eukprot:TRINITY_DN2345_c0_g2_i2.p1 TRINITY_DN2345_c0_g2~~TRINITY_DN2345_c0_g2_i2.p1  ORF type:complete len:439 (+),score=130.26 TRINITY_DN2345_c0_g2_i2:994-2310(+)